MRWAPWLVVVAGSLIRLERYVNDRSLWLDESLLGLNIREKSLHGLLHNLDFNQSAPAGFLAIQKSIVDVLGDSEYALRLFPLVASLLGLVLFTLVARRLLAPWPTLVAVTLFVTGEPLLYQSSEAKPYSSDATIAMLVAWLTLVAVERERDDPHFLPVIPLALAGVVAVWISYPAVFVLAGAFAVLLVRAVETGWRRWVPVIAAVAVAWGVSFLVSYTATSRNISTVSASIFGATTGEEPGSRLRGVADAGWFAIEDPVGFLASTRSIAALCLVVGFAALVLARRWVPVALLGVPPALALVAAYLDKYPFSSRFSIFLVGVAVIVIAHGADEVIAVSRRPWLVGVPLFLLLVVPVAGRALKNVPHPPKREHIRPLLDRIAREWRPGDTLYVYRTTQYPLRYYAECKDCNGPRLPFRVELAPRSAINGDLQAALVSHGPVVVGTGATTLGPELKQLDMLRGKGRVWMLFSHVEHNEEGAFTGYMQTFDRQLAYQPEEGAALYLFGPAKT